MYDLLRASGWRRRRGVKRFSILLFVFALASFNFVDPDYYLSLFYNSIHATNSTGAGSLHRLPPEYAYDMPHNFPNKLNETPPHSHSVNHTVGHNSHTIINKATNHAKSNHSATTANTEVKSEDGIEDDPFATQDPRGEKWTSPFKFKNARHWWQNSDSCFEVDNICRSSQNQWFYYHHHASPSNNNGTTEVPFQPTLELKYMPYFYRRGVWADTRIQLKVHSSSRVSWETLANNSHGGSSNHHCHVSSAPHHVVLQSVFNDMLGEFYLRTLLNLHALLTAEYGDRRESHANYSDTSFIDVILSSKKETQFYAHITLGDKHLLDAHKLLMSGMMPSRAAEKNKHTVTWAKAAIDLIRPEAKKCQCFQKLVFCGYNTYSQQHDASSTHNDAVEIASLPPSQNRIETNYTLWPGKYVDSFGHNVADFSSCKAPSSDFQQYPYHCEAYSNLRTHLLANIGARYPNLAADILQHRKETLLRRQLIDTTYRGDTKEWTFVGLTQRTSRRSWVNLSYVTDACDDAFLNNPMSKQYVICVVVNVEETKSPHEQFLIHRSLDALIGIHGAQMTQAILLPPNSHVLELLPWIPEYARGDWVQTTNAPTPLGVIFHNSDLNHFGYSLNRSSVLLCENVSQEEERDCFMSKENEWKFQWDNRHFFVDVDVVIQFVNEFVLPMRKPCKCKDLLDRQHDRIVLYNIWCEVEGAGNGTSATANSSSVVRHYYRDAVPNIDREHKQEQVLFPRCNLPKSTPTWNYYDALVTANANTAGHASRVTENAPNQVKGEGELAGRIPHRLIFTHKDNLFDCLKSASVSTPPELYNLAENAKATVNAYSRIWPDLEVVFLSDGDCINALNQTEPGLIPWFNSGLEGMYKADLCRAAYLFLHGGYYFDVDILVVRPYVAPVDAQFVTVKGDGFPRDGFFQAFLAAEKGSAIVRRSLKIMLDALWEERPRGKYLGPTALMEAWMELENVTNVWSVKNGNGVYLLNEAKLNEPSSISKYVKLANVIASKGGLDLIQRVPIGHGDNCQFSSGACNVVVISESDETLYFYSRVLGTKWCGKRMMDHGECTTEGVLLERFRQSGLRRNL